jgi:two-component SAPR family response regulator
MSLAATPTLDRKTDGISRVLICEDNHLIAIGWAAILDNAGYTVVGPAHTAEEALGMAYQHLPDLALIDIHLGETIDGISVAAELVPLGVLIIFVTAHHKRAVTDGRQLATDILIKPVLENTILTAVAAALQQKQKAGVGRDDLSE